MLLLISVFSFSQKKDGKPKPKQEIKEKSRSIEIRHAGVLRYDEEIKAKRLIGDVICEHDGAVIKCDSAYFYDSNKFKLEARLKDFYDEGDDKLFYTKRIG